MALVAYDANSDSDMSEEEEEIIKPQVKVNIDPPRKVIEENGHISDEEDFFDHNPESTGIFEEEPDLITLISQKLPNAKLKKMEKSFIDDKEDVSAIPVKKDYGDKVEEPPAKKKKRAGPVQISIPSLADLKDDDDDEKEVVKIQPRQTGSGLFSLLPPPKNRMTRVNRSGSLVPALPTGTPTPGQAAGNLNLKPQGVRKVGLIPHRVANPVKSAPSKPKSADNSDEDSDDDYLGVNSGSYFPAPPAPTSSKYKKINPMPQPSINHEMFINPTPLPPSLPSNNSFVSLNMTEDTPTYTDLGPAVAPYPPPDPQWAAASSSRDLVDDADALMRLAGKQNKLREMKEDGENGGLNIVDVHADDMKGDPRVWLTKAMTEEQAPRPTGKGPKGLAKTRHHITYLAHQAKERDWELKQEWATARENRMASANKYGFI